MKRDLMAAAVFAILALAFVLVATYLLSKEGGLFPFYLFFVASIPAIVAVSFGWAAFHPEETESEAG